MTNQPFFTRDGDVFMPTAIASGPWDPKSLHGRGIVGLLAFAIEQRHGAADFVPARLTVDMFRLPGFAPIEVKFHDELLRRLEIDPSGMPGQRDRSGWPRWKELLTERFLTRTRDDWCRILEGTDACFAPVLSMAEAHAHPHNQARSAFIDVGGERQPAPAPRFGTTKLAPPRPPGSVPLA